MSRVLLIQCHATPPESLRVDDWTPWRNVTDRAQCVAMAAHKFAMRDGRELVKVHVYHVWDDAPKHPKGSPVRVDVTEFNAHREQLQTS